MHSDFSYIVVLVTAKDRQEAEVLAERLLEQRLAACVNIVSGIKSLFRWKGKIEREEEALLLIKTRRDCFGRLKQEISQAHSYDLPEIIALPIVEGSREYLAWLEETIN